MGDHRHTLGMGAGEVVQGDPQGTAWPSRQTGMSLELDSRSYGFAYVVEEFEFYL